MKLYFTALVCILCLFPDLYAQIPYTVWDKVKVGKEPISINVAENPNSFIVLCLGSDANFDGVKQDSLGDENPSAWYLEIRNDEINVSKIFEFAFRELSLFYPIYPGVNRISNEIWIPTEKTFSKSPLRIFTLNKEFIERVPVSYPVTSAVSVNFHEDKEYILSRENENGTLYKRNSLGSIDSVFVGTNPLQAIPFDDGRKVAVLTEGAFGGKGDVKIIDMVSLKTIDTIDAGTSPNNISIIDDSLYIVVNGEHKILSMPLVNFDSITEYPISSTGYDGPRQIISSNEDELFLTSYSTKVFFPNKGEALELGVKTESASIFSDNSFKYILIAAPHKQDYTPYDSLIILKNTLSGVDFLNNELLVNCFPNPAKETITLSYSSKNSSDYTSALLFDLLGNLIARFDDMPSGKNVVYKIDIKDLNLDAGIYYLSINNNLSNFLIKITVEN